MKQTFFLWLLMSSSPLFAQSIFTREAEKENNKKIELSGYARGSLYGGNPENDFSALFGESCLKINYKPKNSIVYTDIRFRSGIRFDEPYTAVEIKEAFAGYSGDKLDVLLGNQIVTWGRADGFNPTNNLNPSDYFFLSAESDDQRLSNFLFRLRYRVTSKVDLDLVAIPVYKPSEYRYDLFRFEGDASFAELSKPEKRVKNSSLAARLNFELSQIGFSFSWFRGYDPFYGFEVQSVDWSAGSPVITHIPKPYLKNTFGIDFALPLGSLLIRGEMARNLTGNNTDKMYVPNPDWYYVAGLESNFGGLTTIIQYIGKFTSGFTALTEPVLTDPMNPQAQLQYANGLIYYESSLFNRKIFHQQEETNHAASLTLILPLAYETWNVEVSAYYNFTSDEYLVRPNVKWKITDALSATAGYAYMDGPEKSIFSYTAPILNGAFFELKVNF